MLSTPDEVVASPKQERTERFLRTAEGSGILREHLLQYRPQHDGSPKPCAHVMVLSAVFLADCEVEA